MAGAAGAVLLVMVFVNMSGVSATREGVTALGEETRRLQSTIDSLAESAKRRDRQTAGLQRQMGLLQQRIGELQEAHTEMEQEMRQARKLSARRTRARLPLLGRERGRRNLEGLLGEDAELPQDREAREEILRKGAEVLATDVAERFAERLGLTAEERKKLGELVSVAARDAAELLPDALAGDMDEDARERVRGLMEHFGERGDEFIRGLSDEKRKKLDDMRNAVFTREADRLAERAGLGRAQAEQAREVALDIAREARGIWGEVAAGKITPEEAGEKMRDMIEERQAEFVKGLDEDGRRKVEELFREWRGGGLPGWGAGGDAGWTPEAGEERAKEAF